MRGGLAIDSSVQREDHFGCGFFQNAAYQTGDAEFVRTYGIKSRKGAAKDVVATLEDLTAFQRPEIGDVFDNANFSGGAAVIGTCLLYTSRCV